MDRAGLVEAADRIGLRPSRRSRRPSACRPRTAPRPGPTGRRPAASRPGRRRASADAPGRPRSHTAGPLCRLQRPNSDRPVLAGREACRPSFEKAIARPHEAHRWAGQTGVRLRRSQRWTTAPELQLISARPGGRRRRSGRRGGAAIRPRPSHRRREDHRREDRVQGEHDARPVGAPAERRDAILHGVRDQPALAGGRVPDVHGFIGGEDARSVRAERGVAAVSVLDVDLVQGGVGSGGVSGLRPRASQTRAVPDRSAVSSFVPSPL